MFARYGDTFDTKASGADYDIDDVFELVAIVDRMNVPVAGVGPPGRWGSGRSNERSGKGEGFEVQGARRRRREPPGLDGKFHLYIFDVVAQDLHAGRSCDSVERAVSLQRHEQERLYTEQEADPELFDLPFISTDPDLVARAERDGEYRTRLQRDLDSEARDRMRRR